MMHKPRCRYCEVPVSYFGEICVDCCDGLSQEEAQERAMNDPIIDLTAQQERAQMGIDY